jgi:hypothetical protein
MLMVQTGTNVVTRERGMKKVIGCLFVLLALAGCWAKPINEAFTCDDFCNHHHKVKVFSFEPGKTLCICNDGSQYSDIYEASK